MNRSTGIRFVRLVPLLPLLLLVSGLAGCQPWAAITTEPQNAKLQLNGQPLHDSPVDHQTFDFGVQKQQELVASQDGYFDSSIKLQADSPEIQAHAVHLKLMRDQAGDATLESDAANNWVRMQVSSQFTPEQAWQKVVDEVTSRYSALQQMNEDSGYLRSEWFSKSFPHPTRGTMVVRTQFIGNVASRDPLVYKVKVTSQVSYADAPEKWTDYPRIYKEDDQLIKEIQSRLMVH